MEMIKYPDIVTFGKLRFVEKVTLLNGKRPMDYLDYHREDPRCKFQLPVDGNDIQLASENQSIGGEFDTP